MYEQHTPSAGIVSLWNRVFACLPLTDLLSSLPSIPSRSAENETDYRESTNPKVPTIGRSKGGLFSIIPATEVPSGEVLAESERQNNFAISIDEGVEGSFVTHSFISRDSRYRLAGCQVSGLLEDEDFRQEERRDTKVRDIFMDERVRTR